MCKEVKGMHCKRCDDEDDNLLRPIDIADRLENLECLIRTCTMALLSRQDSEIVDVVFILQTHVINELKTAQKEIWKL